jgi:hypothetical protein
LRTSRIELRPTARSARQDIRDGRRLIASVLDFHGRRLGLAPAGAAALLTRGFVVVTAFFQAFLADVFHIFLLAIFRCKTGPTLYRPSVANL